MNRRTLIAAALALAATGSAAFAQVQALPKEDRALVDQAGAYLEGLKMAKGRFVQTNSRGAMSAGVIYIDRPGKARFEYDPPAQMTVVADGRNVAVYDQRLKTFDRYPLGATPLGIFLSRRIRFDDQVKVDRVIHSDLGFAVAMSDARGQADGRLVLEFAANPVTLTGWTVVDQQGIETHVRLDGFMPVEGLDPALFVLADPRKASPPAQ